MAWCGFDELMRTGINIYGDGVARAITTKAIERNVSVAEQLAQEKKELKTLEEIIQRRLLSAIDTADTSMRLRAFVGMVAIARFLIEESKFENASRPSFLNKSNELGGLIESFDNHYEFQPSHLGHPVNANIALDLTIPKMKFKSIK